MRIRLLLFASILSLSLSTPILASTQNEATALLNSAAEDIYAGKWQAADEKLSKSEELDPSFYGTFSNHAFVLSKLGRLDEALAKAETAQKLAPNEPDPLFAKASIYQQQGRLQESLTHYQQLVDKFPSYPKVEEIRSLIKGLSGDLQRQKDIATQVGAAANPVDDYFEHATYDHVAKWSAEKFPLKVFVQSDEDAAKVPGYKPEYGVAVKNAFEEWQKKSDNAVSFVYVPKPEEADIECFWTNDISKLSNPSEGGDAKVRFQASAPITHSKITILTEYPTGIIKQPSPAVIQYIALHEIGHSLGILGHSPDRYDVMYGSAPLSAESRTLTARDTNTLLQLYRPDVQLSSHIRNPSTKEQWTLKGAEFMKREQYKEALSALDSAMKLDANYMPARMNAIGCLSKLAVQSAKANNYQDALKYLKRAQELHTDKSNKELTAGILRNLSIIYDKLNRPKDAAATRQLLQKL